MLTEICLWRTCALRTSHEVGVVCLRDSATRSQATKTREGAAVLVAQLLTRRDVEPQLISFTDWGDSCWRAG
jgi:hypothetical protein